MCFRHGVSKEFIQALQNLSQKDPTVSKIIRTDGKRVFQRCVICGQWIENGRPLKKHNQMEARRSNEELASFLRELGMSEKMIRKNLQP